ncbi:hypothetical protein ACFPM1_00425 [Halorubrum rubrum]|uniref:Uncharacterized protein n=1 Tax=Halorubrum rubrum TaxID=1126240 RepID=A0ABD5QX15_9EURY|nr:hypothetical protein [Halorubrum rubrum]
MADDKSGRDKQAHDEERRQREREIATELERGDEAEPPVDASALASFETALESVPFPATGAEIVSAVGDREIASTGGAYAVAELLPDADEETFDSPAAVGTRVQRPTVAAAMKRVVEAVARLPNAETSRSQREAYERTFRALAEVDGDDDDEGIDAIADWIVERTAETERVPGSRDVRRQAAKFCRENGYEVRDDEWLGV